ncbi:hypothetical protein A9X01_24225 [Mycobacterium asiaticum]|uniref:Diacylglycerol O-acyltransferase n=1 Tax=Mycobacterium asiaticum TaxID=1790 RepID=A0A1A3C2G9_MYCAS|nr:hypothetical protein A9X01_24225 [Mycobacterium asiaticum]
MAVGHRMAAVDAQFYWMSAKVPSDQFLLYAFDGEPDDVDSAIDRVRDRARACADLSMRVADDCAARYPRWVPAPPEPDQIVRHELSESAGAGWDGCLVAVAGLAAHQLDIRQMAWRLHIFTPVDGIPGVPRPGTVTVLQVAHALGDGARASAMAAWLFGRPVPVPTVTATRPGFAPRLAVAAARAHRTVDTGPGVRGYRRP